MHRLSAAEARRIALAAQGFAAPRPAGVKAGGLRRLAGRLGALQIDSVNVLARAHYLPAFSRLGPYPMGALDELAYRRRALFEYWGHEASLIPIELFGLFRWRMRPDRVHPRFAAWAEQKAAVIRAVEQEIIDRGPLAASELHEKGPRSGPWWGWNDQKTALEWLFLVGRVTAAARRNFERVYDLTERVIPPAIYQASWPEEREAKKRLLLVAARALGIATAKDLFDYFRLRRAELLLTELLEEGALARAQVEGWTQPAVLFPGTRLPRTVQARALLAPFDPLVWERSRAERLFGFRYRIEIYVPAPKRVHGYYVLPFLLGDELVARVDLKADRKAGALLVQAAWREDGRDAGALAEALAGELRLMAAWLGLGRVSATPRGTMAAALRRSLRGAPAR